MKFSNNMEHTIPSEPYWKGQVIYMKVSDSQFFTTTAGIQSRCFRENKISYAFLDHLGSYWDSM